MPCQLIYLTDKPVRETGPNKRQDLRLSVDLGGASELDLVATIYEGTDVTIRVLTGMHIESDIGWVAAGSDFDLTTAIPSVKQHITGLLRYVRWELVTSGTTTFTIAGMARSLC
jgi:hypothetical protein